MYQRPNLYEADFQKIAKVKGGGVYLPANLIVTEFPAEQGFYDTNDRTEPPGGGGDWGGDGDFGDDEGTEGGAGGGEWIEGGD